MLSCQCSIGAIGNIGLMVPVVGTALAQLVLDLAAIQYMICITTINSLNKMPTSADLKF